jgi:hypothetical protein
MVLKKSLDFEKTNKITYKAVDTLQKYVLLKMRKFLETAELFHKMPMYVLYAGGPSFSNFTTVIVINFESDYLSNHLTWRNV